MEVFYLMGDSQNHSLRIIEWNINCCKTLSKSKKWNKIAECITSTESPDILVLTECGTNFEAVNFDKMLGNLTETEWEIRYNNDRTHNYIAVLVNTHKKNSNIEVTISNNLFDDNHTGIHPDRVAVDITFKDNSDDSSKSIRMLGIRMNTGGLTLEQRILQNIQLVHDIQALKPDIIIGDFNTCSEMESLNIYNVATWKGKNIIWEGKGKERKLKPKFCKWNEWLVDKFGKNNEYPTNVLATFCKFIESKNKEYQYWAGDERNPFSYKPIRSNIATAPDTLVWNSRQIISVKANYHPNLCVSDTCIPKKPKEIEENWPSDHCMLIADIEIPSGQHLAEDS